MYYYFARWSKPGGQCLVLVSKRKDSYGTSFADDARLDAELSLMQYHCNVSPLGWETKNIFSVSGSYFKDCGLFVFIAARKRSLRQGNVFTSVCQSFCSGGSLYDVTSCLAAWCHAPFARVSLWSHVLSRGCLCVWSHIPSGEGLCSGGGSPWTEDPTPLDRDPPDRDP